MQGRVPIMISRMYIRLSGINKSDADVRVALLGGQVQWSPPESVLGLDLRHERRDARATASLLARAVGALTERPDRRPETLEFRPRRRDSARVAQKVRLSTLESLRG